VLEVKMNKTERKISTLMKLHYDPDLRDWRTFTTEEIATLLHFKLPEVKKALKKLAESGNVTQTEKREGAKMTKLTLQEKITADVDDALYALAKKIQKKYKLSWEKTKTHTNYSLRLLMLSFPEEWLKK